MPDHDSLRRTITAAAGAPRSARITLGATDPRGRVAWIESPDDIATLFVADQGKILLERELARTDTRDYGYEGCSAHYLSWHGQRLVVVTRERNSSFLQSIEPESGRDEFVGFSHAWQIDRDLVLWVDHDPGLVCMSTLPSLEARPPVPFRGAPASGDIDLKVAGGARNDGQTLLQVAFSSYRGGGLIDTLALPTDRQRAEHERVDDLPDAIERRLFPAANSSADLRFIVEAVAHAFMRASPEKNRRSCWQPSPVWMPIYWHRHLIATGRHTESAQLLDLLDEIASPLAESEPEYGWDPGWSARDGQIEMASRYVRRQSRTLAAAIRAGALPRGWYCLLFDPAPQSKVAGSRVDPSGFPLVLRQMFERLAETNPERLPSA